MKNEPIPTDLREIDLLTYYALSYIYKLYRDGVIDRNGGSQLKQSILHAYETATAIRTKHSNMWARIEQAATNYSHTPTLDNADKFYAAVYGLPDDWRVKRT